MAVFTQVDPGRTLSRMASPRDHEAIFSDLLAAYMQRDMARLARAHSERVTLRLPGATSAAGTYTGVADVVRVIEGIRGALEATTTPPRFEHEGNRMVVLQHGRLRGLPAGGTDLWLRIHVTFDDVGHILEVEIEPDDAGRFDAVIAAALASPGDG